MKLRPLDPRLRRAAHFAIPIFRRCERPGHADRRRPFAEDLAVLTTGVLLWVWPIEGRLDSVGREAAGATLTGAVLAFKVRDILSK
jgi:hypothetical protein